MISPGHFIHFIQENNSPITLVASLLRGILASTRAELGVSNNARILAVKQHILHILVFEVRSFEDVLQIRLGEA